MTRFRGKLPVEPLPKHAYDRIAEEVFCELDAGIDRAPAAPERATLRRHTALLTVAFALVAAVIGLVWRTSQSNPPLATASRIVTEPSMTQATLGDATVEAAPASAFISTGSDAAGWTVTVEKGSIAFTVPKRMGRPPFRVEAADVAIEVVGTRFTVVRVARLVRVGVEEGVVKVTSGGQARLLHRGERWENQADTAKKIDTKEMPATFGSASPTVSKLPDLAPGRSAAAVRSAASPSNAGKQPSRRERYESASSLEASQPNEAVSIYLDLGSGNDAWAANALYAAARLEFERGRYAHARRLLEQYRRRFPDGHNAHEARTLLDRMK
jgi:hypothetical protein